MKLSVIKNLKVNVTFLSVILIAFFIVPNLSGETGQATMSSYNIQIIESYCKKW